MRVQLYFSFLLCIVLTLVSCENAENSTDKKTPQVIEKYFGLLDSESDSISVELPIHTFDTFDELIKQTEAIICSDSLPKITLTHQNEVKNIYLRNPCRENYACILIKQKNIIEIHNDTINKLDETFYPLDSLTAMLKRDLENNGQNPHLCDSPEKLLIYLSYDTNGIARLPNTLHLLTQAYEEISNRTDIKIWLHKRIPIPPMPPPPAELEEIELMEDE